MSVRVHSQIIDHIKMSLKILIKLYYCLLKTSKRTLIKS